MGNSKKTPMIKKTKKIKDQEITDQEIKDKEYTFDDLHDMTLSELQHIIICKQEVLNLLNEQKHSLGGYILYLQSTAKKTIGDKNAEKM